MQTMESAKKRRATRACAALSALAIALLLAPSSQAQNRERGPEQMQQRLQERLTRLTEDLGLSDKQVKALRPIFEGQMREMRQLRQSRGGGPQAGPQGGPGEGRNAMRKILTDTRAKIAKVLDEGQLAKFDAINQRRDRQRFGRGERGPRPNRDGRDADGRPHPPRGDGNRALGDGPPPHPPGDGIRPHGEGTPPPGHPPLPPKLEG